MCVCRWQLIAYSELEGRRRSMAERKGHQA
jgi:hypothetical protein